MAFIQKFQNKDFRVFQCQFDNAEDLKRVGGHKNIAAQKPHSDSSNKKRTSEFVSEILVMTDNDPNKSIISIARDVVVSEFFYQAGSA